ncbi:hypothetical protein NLJ89_g1892 [Agrocybe chaxingu]|uniref:F-box domain-containing protein n=1 Tax=Agrocybe chaxingu TaxID=84603 RepID=A0A9W8MZ67_9AGAR|nr:hypothetical protein NLJ89_g1892 [Agrocybe chaxingu]
MTRTPRIEYTGPWSVVDSQQFDNVGFAGPTYGDTEYTATARDASFSFKFNGTSVYLQGTRAPLSASSISNHVTWECVLDGNSREQPRGTSLPTSFNNFIYCKFDGLSLGEHTFGAKVTSDGANFYVDRIAYGSVDSSPPQGTEVVQVDFGDPEIRYSPEASFSTTPNFGNVDRFSDQRDATISFDFTGTSVTWYTPNSTLAPSKASYQLDNESPVQFDIPGGFESGSLPPLYQRYFENARAPTRKTHADCEVPRASGGGSTLPVAPIVGALVAALVLLLVTQHAAGYIRAFDLLPPSIFPSTVSPNAFQGPEICQMTSCQCQIVLCDRCRQQNREGKSSGDRQACVVAGGTPCEPCRQLADIDAEIVNVETYLEKLKRSRYPLQTRRNHIHDPMLKNLPHEVVSRIFASCVVADYESRSQHYSPRRLPLPFVLGAVCKPWREIAWRTPQLWTRISISVPSSDKLDLHREIIEQWLSRSGRLPLSLHLEASKLRSYVVNFIQPDQPSRDNLPPISPTYTTCPHLRHLHVMPSSNNIPALLLRRLVRRPNGEHPEPHPALGVYLKSFDIRGRLEQDTLVELLRMLTSLESLSVHPMIYFYAESFFKAFAQRIGEVDVRSRHSSIFLPNLRVVKYRGPVMFSWRSLMSLLSSDSQGCFISQTNERPLSTISITVPACEHSDHYLDVGQIQGYLEYRQRNPGINLEVLFEEKDFVEMSAKFRGLDYEAMKRCTWDVNRYRVGMQ